MALVEAFLEISDRPTISAMLMGIVQVLGPVWIPFLLGVLLGWAWKPRWVSFGYCKFDISAPSSSSTVVQGFGSIQSTVSCENAAPSLASGAVEVLGEQQTASPAIDDSICSSSEVEREDDEVVTYKDLDHLCYLVERKDGGPPWKHVMDRSTQDMSYQAWQRDPETGPPQYCSRTVYEDASPELLRDFFWDDEFRLKWDNMLVHAAVLEAHPITGTMVVHWIRKFPFFCSDREYLIGRRIWESGQSYYCITKGVPSELVPRKDKPRRVDLYYSSWHIRAVASRKGNGQLSACEVILFHHEDMGIPWEIAKFGVRQGMWGTVKSIGRGFRAYQKHRATEASLSHHALIAQINTKLDPDYMSILERAEDSPETRPLVSADEKPNGANIPKLVAIGLAVAVACSLDRGLLTKSLIFGVARTFGNIGRRLRSTANRAF